MRIAVTTTGTAPSASVDRRFGRAQRFLIVDTGSDTVEVVDNTQNLQAAQGAGIQAAQNVADADVDVLLTGHVGPKAFATLQAAGITVVTGAAGTVEEAVAAFLAGEIRPAAQADVNGHW
ncbi:MAG: NifB/NifX family molybdenum-iron cluster-binding protein [Planctomycetota bacterium]